MKVLQFLTYNYTSLFLSEKLFTSVIFVRKMKLTKEMFGATLSHEINFKENKTLNFPIYVVAFFQGEMTLQGTIKRTFLKGNWIFTPRDFFMDLLQMSMGDVREQKYISLSHNVTHCRLSVSINVNILTERETGWYLDCPISANVFYQNTKQILQSWINGCSPAIWLDKHLATLPDHLGFPPQPFLDSL